MKILKREFYLLNKNKLSPPPKIMAHYYSNCEIIKMTKKLKMNIVHQVNFCD